MDHGGRTQSGNRDVTHTHQTTELGSKSQSIVAVSRGLIALLESYQQPDGSVLVPEALRPWVGKDWIAAH